MSSSTIDMSRLSEAINKNISASRTSTSSTTLSRVPSFTYPLARVHARTAMPSPPPSPTLSPVGDEAANIAHGKVKTTCKLNDAPENPASGVSSWANIPRLRLPAGVDPDEDDDDDEEGGWDLDLFTLAIRTVDSVEIIRRNTDEKKWRVGSCASRGSKAVFKEAMRSVERIVRKGIVGLVRRFSS